jgi:hypothetical protein
MVAALSFPIPAIPVREEIVFEERTARFPYLFFSSWATWITDFPLVPVLRSIAISSVSVKF